MPYETEHQDFIATELLGELKAENVRKDNIIQKQHTTIRNIIIASFISIMCLVAGFLIYLNQYDFTSTTTNTADGVYAIIDSDGNTIATDLTSDEIGELLNGESDENDNQIED